MYRDLFDSEIKEKIFCYLCHAKPAIRKCITCGVYLCEDNNCLSPKKNPEWWPNYEKHIRDRGGGTYRYLLRVTPLFDELMRKHGKLCSKCKLPFIPQSVYTKAYPRVTHYPTEDICGFCVYDMDAYEHSQIADEDDWRYSSVKRV